MDNQKNIERFEEIVKKVNRPGFEKLLKYVRTSDFYTAPASTRFHLACEGGLLQHSLNVYDCLMEKKKNPVWEPVLAAIPEESLIIVALFHDICKTKFYKKTTRNQKTYDKEKVQAAENWQRKHDQAGDFIWESVETYTVEDQMPLGHGEKSVMILQQYITLGIQEVFSIRWHMGFAEDQNNINNVSLAMEKYPLVLALFEADMEASKLLEEKQA